MSICGIIVVFLRISVTTMKNSVVKIDINDKIYGGRQYENEFIHLLDGQVIFKRIYIMKYEAKVLNFFRMFAILIYYKFFFSGTLLLTNATTIFAGIRTKNIVIIHHIDTKFSLRPTILYNWFCNHYFYARKQFFDKIIVVAEIWKQMLEDKGFKNVIKIYNSFDVKDYQFSDSEKQEFKVKYNLVGKPIIYIGNCQILKGAQMSYEKLKDMDAFLVTSGIKDIDIPTIHLALPFKDYKLLLATADVVLTMSLFMEGWNRTAHEASLCGTPVIGTGTGGMKELLTIAEQTITDFEHLHEKVLEALQKKYAPTEELQNLNLEYFKQSWLKVFM